MSLSILGRGHSVWLAALAVALAPLAPPFVVPPAAGMVLPDAPYVPPTAPVPAAVLPQQPRAFVNTTIAPPVGGTVRHVPPGGDLQGALNNAKPGDVIVLQAGATYAGDLTLPEKAGSGWIYIESSALSSLPAPGTRVSPSQASLMPKIVDTAARPAIQAAASAHHYRVIGIEITTTSAAASTTPYYALVNLEAPGGNTSISRAPRNIIVDRCYIHANPGTNILHGVVINGADLAVLDSYISEIHAVANESHGIVGWNGPGPFKIVNNEIQAAGVNVMFTQRPRIQNLIPSDIEIRENHLDKPLSWFPGGSTYAGVPWAIKNNFELKNAARVLVDGNVFEHAWPGNFETQDGFCVLFTVRGVDAPWSVVEDVTFTHNLVRHCSAGIDFLGHDYNGPSQEQRRILVQNNLFTDIGPYSTLWTAGLVFQVTDGGANYVIDHNTALSTAVSRAGNPIYAQVHRASSWPATGLVFTNNIAHGAPGVCGDKVGCGMRALEVYFPGAVFARNVLVGGKRTDYPADNAFAAALEEAGLTNVAQGDYRLAGSSPHRHAGTDGRDIGADHDALQKALGRSLP